MVVAIAAPAHAQLAGAVTIESDTRLRGYSISYGQPTVTGQIDYDTRSGVYASGSVTSAWVDEKAQFVGWQGAVGYARQISRKLSIDTGISRVDYHPVNEYTRGISYNEIYAGVTWHPVTVRVAWSPDYRSSHTRTLYAELAASYPLARHFVVSAHFAELLYLSQPTANTGAYSASPAAAPYLPDLHDWSLAAARKFGRVEVRASLTGAGTNGSRAGRPDRPAVISVGAAWFF